MKSVTVLKFIHLVTKLRWKAKVKPLSLTEKLKPLSILVASIKLESPLIGEFVHSVRLLDYGYFC